eukprot:TRINITY_DN910_c0_g1_i4.p2 TRINITY_DN910_c0_g1~~TRINITY_DN910_c0_g1_i4.p2  ORF type:complete len:222 (-),score=41.92 TRINITY_DN910_c0_g1_i4:133-798(-)
MCSISKEKPHNSPPKGKANKVISPLNKNGSACGRLRSARSETSLEEFMQRQKLHVLRKKQRAEEGEVERSHSPKINDKSREMASKLGDFDERRELISLRRMRFKFPGVKEQFTPKINKLPKYFPKPATCAKPKEPVQTPTFSPSLNKSKEYGNIKSRLRLRDSIDTLLERIRQENKEKERVYNKVKCERNLNEELECTHKPRILPDPTYLKYMSTYLHTAQ